MFKNIAKKIKVLVYVLLILSCVGFYILAILRISHMPENASREEIMGTIFISTLIFAVGSFLSWVGCFTLYAFGELIDRISHIDEMLTDKLEGKGDSKLLSVLEDQLNAAENEIEDTFFDTSFEEK